MRVSASKVGLLSQCAYWARPEAQWSKRSSDAADRGTRFHAAIAEYVSLGDVRSDQSANGDIAEMLISAIAWVDHFGRERLAAEVAFAWDPATDRAERIDVKDRAYPDDGRVCGTADLVAVSRATKVGYIADWSTGDGSHKGPQLRTLAMMLSRAEGLESVTVEALEVDDTGVRHLCIEILDAFALDAVAGELAENLAAIATAEPVPGAHCAELYCPARVACPAGVAIVEQIIPAADLVRHQWGLTIHSAEHAAWLLERARLVASSAEEVKDAVKAYVPPEGLCLEDGSLLVEGRRNMPRRDHKKLEALARACGATEEQIAGCDYVAVESSGLRVKKPAASKKRKAA